jgi:hypothetical protein
MAASASGVALRRACWVATLALLGLFAPGGPRTARATEWQGDAWGGRLDGQALTYTLWVVTPDGAANAAGERVTADTATVVERIRPMGELWYDRDASLEVAWDLVPQINPGNTATGITLAPRSPLRLPELALDGSLHDGSGDPAGWRLSHNLDRAVVRWTAPAFEVRAGRQAIGHGSARLLIAADLFTGFGPTALGVMYKRGVDALRVTVPLNEQHELEAYAVAHDERWTAGMALLRWRGSFTGVVDVSVIAGYSHGLPTVAWDLSGDLGGSGWYLEGSARHDPQGPQGKGVAGQELTERRWMARATLGLDHRFETGTRVNGELHVSSVGERDPDDYLLAAQRLPYAVGESFLLGVAYAALAVDHEISALWRGGLAGIVNLTDGSALIAPSLAWDVADEVTFAMGGFVGAGKRPTVWLPSGGAVDLGLPRSEFGSLGAVVYTDLRLAF